MTVALILSVVALVAVSQPIFEFPPHPFQPCELIGFEMQCCWPPQYGGCQAPPGFRGPLPPNYLPPPDFLDQVCCKQTQECCPRDQTNWNPSFRCCDADTHKCVVTDKKGECVVKNATDPVTPDIPHLEATGQCPADGSIPFEIAPGNVLRCTLNSEVSGYTCPTDTHCVRDNSGNKNSGVCCRDTTETDSAGVVTDIGCNQYNDCHSCVNNAADAKAPCGWLSEGSLSNRHPRCVINCDNFPTKSCILPSNGDMCPIDTSAGTTKDNATQINTGTCESRCNVIGTGRAVGINNQGNRMTTPSVNRTVTTDACCMEYPGDYCCDHWGQIALHCTRGRVRQGPQCGVPVRGTPNALYRPEFEPLGPYAPAMSGTPWPNPYGPFPPYGQPFGYGPQAPGLPYGPYGPMMGGPVPYGPMPYGQFYGPYRNGEVVAQSVEADVKQLMFYPPPAYYPQPPPPAPQRIPPVASINPSPFVCSCDGDCMEYDDCCDDYADECIW